MGSSLYNRYLQSTMGQIFRHLHSDKPGSYHHAGLGPMLLYKMIDFIRIRNIAQGKNMIFLHACYFRADRSRSR